MGTAFMAILKVFHGCRQTRESLGRQHLLVGLLLLCGTLALDTAAGDDATSNRKQNRIKSAFILNIARFVYWPGERSGPDSPFHLCLLRENPYGEAALALESRTIHQRPIKLHIIEELPDPGSCQLLFIPLNQLKGLPPGFNQPGLLTISDLSDVDRSTPQLGRTMVSLIREESHLGIAVNRKLGEQHRLKFSSELLKLSRLVEGPETGPLKVH
jgi:hypothetical protein